MPSVKSFIAIFVLIVAAVAVFLTAYIVREGTQVIVTTFGNPTGTPITTAGIHFKLPWQDARIIEKRILNWDGHPNQVPTKDKKFIEVDTTARWRIVDPLRFIQTVQNERGARSRLDAILDAITRDVVSGHNLVEVVRSSNTILERRQEEKAKASAAAAQQAADGIAATESSAREDSAVQIESITMGRERLGDLVIERAKQELLPLGIEVVDVQFKRISYEESVEKKVYERMISERERIAERIRSIGKGERAIIDGKISRDLQQIRSEAYKRAEEIRGEAEARAIRIYASAMNAEPGLYKFLRTLETYGKTIKKDTKMILSTESEFLRYLKQY